MYCLAFAEIGKPDVAVAGGKGASLGELAQSSFPVPPGFVVSTKAYREQSSTPSAAFQTELLTAFDRLGATRVAVRSSAIAEDSPQASWAGQFETYLNVNRGRLLAAVQGCWASAASKTVREYAKIQSVGETELAMAVVVQKMVESQVAGVAFSMNPVTGNRDEIMIEAVYGLGELLVQGTITPDNYLVDKHQPKILSKSITHKSLMLTYHDGKNAQLPVPAAKANTACLTDCQILELAELVAAIEKHYGRPQDVEWATENAKVYIVQSRPVTTP